MKKKQSILLLTLLMLVALFVSCGKKEPAADTASSDSAKTTETTEQEPVKLLIAAAASLEYSFKDDLIPMFEKANPNITVEGSYDSSGKLQTQIEEGLEADLFFSAAPKQMNALVDKDLISKDTVVDLLENKIVLIAPKDKAKDYTKFEDIANASQVALGDPESVPVGQYSKESLTSLGLWDQVSGKASFGTNVTEVLNWVASGSADLGIVYATDAATTDDVAIVAEAPASSLKAPVIYPVGIVKSTKHEKEAKLFEEFLQSDDALKIFEKYGFTINK